eukprot:314722_1
MSQWQKKSIILSNSSFSKDHIIFKILTLNEAELLVFTDNNMPNNSQLREIWTYNIYNDSYTKLIHQTSMNEIIKYYTASLNDNKSFLYLFGELGQIIKLNLKTKQFEVSNKSYHDGSGSRSLFINGQFHIFGGREENDKYHFVWDENKKQLIKVYFFKQIKNALHGHMVHYLKTKNCVLIIPSEPQCIYLYSLSTHECDILPINI